MTEPPGLALEGVCAGYGDTVIVEGVALDLPPGGTLAVLGRNGVGKTTLLATIMGHTKLHGGRIRFGGREISNLPPYRRARLGIGFVPQEREIFPSLTVEENLRLGADVGRKGEIGFTDIWRLFPMLEERRRQKAGSLSGGQQQMVALGRALLANPRLLLCDEISFGLAPRVINELYTLIPGIKQRGIGILIVEQDIERSLAVADRFYCLLEGKVSLTGRPREVTRDLVMTHYFGL